MESYMWNDDFFLPQDLGLDFLADQSDGQYGDLKELDQVSGDFKHTQCEDVIEQLSLPSGQGSLTDMTWMESDIGSLLDALNTHQEPSSSDLFDITSSLPIDSGVKDNISLLQLPVPNDIQNALVSLQTQAQDFMLTPPESPEQQVHPVIKIEETWSSSNDVSPEVPTDEPLSLPESNLVFQGSIGFDTISLSVPTQSNLPVQESVSFLGSPLTADDVENVLSSPEPLSPQSPGSSSLIQSSPELYKVIAAPSNLSHRFSPYSKQKDELKSKSRAKAAKSSVSPVSDECSNLSKKDRKKVQNKNAAIRYRQKKKEEAKSIYSEVEGLEDRNQELKVKVEDLEREIRYMKNLMEDIQKAKGRVTVG